MPMEETGVRAIVDGVAQYQQDAARVNAATQSMVTGAESAARQSRAIAERQGQAIQAMGQRMREVGQQAVLLGAALSAPGLLSAGFAARFEQDFAGVRKTVDGTTAQLADLRAELLNLTRSIPTSPGGLAAIAENAGALGVARENIVDFTRVTAQLAATTNLTADAASTSLAQFANILQIPLTQIDRVGAALVDLGNNGASTEAQILDFALRLAGAGKVIGLSASEVLGFSNALASLGINAEAGGTAFSRVFVEIAKAVQVGGDDLTKFAEVAGVSSAEFAKAFQQDAAGAIIQFVEGLGKITAAGGRTFQTLEELSLGDNRLRDSLLRASGGGDILRASIERGGQAFRDNTALVTEFGKRAETASSQIQLLRNDLQRLAIRAGDALLPALKTGIGLSRSLVDGLSGLPTPVLAAGAAFSILAGGLATTAASAVVLLGTLGNLVGGFQALTGMGVGAAFASLARNIVAVTAALGAFAVSPAGLVILGLTAATVGAIAAYRHFTSESEAVAAAQARLAEANDKQAEAMRSLASATRELNDAQSGKPTDPGDERRTKDLDTQTASVKNLTEQTAKLIEARNKLATARSIQRGERVIPEASPTDRTPTEFGRSTLTQIAQTQESAQGRGFRRTDLNDSERANFDFAASILGIADPLARIDPLVLQMTRSLSDNEKVLLRDAAAARLAAIAQRELVQAAVATATSASDLTPDESAGREARALSEISSARDRLRNSMDAQQLALSSIVRGSEIEREAENRLKAALENLQRVRDAGRAAPPATGDVEAERRATEDATRARRDLNEARDSTTLSDVQTAPLTVEQAAADETAGAYRDLNAARATSPERPDATSGLSAEEQALQRVTAAEERLARIRSGTAAPEGQTDGLATEEQAIAELEAAYAALNAIRATAPVPPVVGFGDEEDALRALEDAYGRIDDVRLTPATPGTPDFTAEEQAIADVAGQYGALDERRSTAADPGVPDFTPEEQAIAALEGRYADLDRVRQPEGQAQPAPDFTAEEAAVADVAAAYGDLDVARGAPARDPAVPDFTPEEAALRDLEGAYAELDAVRSQPPGTPAAPSFEAEQDALRAVEGAYAGLDARRAETPAQPGAPDFTPEEAALQGVAGAYEALDAVRQQPVASPEAPGFDAERAAIAGLEDAYGDLDAQRREVSQPPTPDLSGETAAVADVAGAYRDLDAIRREGAGTPEVPSFAAEQDAIAGVEYAYGELNERRGEVANPPAPDFSAEREALGGVEAAYGALDDVRQRPAIPAVPDFTAEREAAADVARTYDALDERRGETAQPPAPDFTAETDAIARVEGAYGDLDAVRAAQPEVETPDFTPERDAIAAVEGDYDALNRARSTTAAPDAQTVGLDAEQTALQRVQQAQEELDALRNAPARATDHTGSLTAEAAAVARLVAAQLDLQKVRVGGGERDRSDVLDAERTAAERDRAVLDELAAARGRTDDTVDRTDPLISEAGAAADTERAYDALNVAREATPPDTQQAGALDAERAAALRAQSAQEALDAVRGGTTTPEAQTAPLVAEAAAADTTRESLGLLDEARGQTTAMPDQTAGLDAETEAADAARVARQDLDAVRRVPGEAANHTGDLAAEESAVRDVEGAYSDLAATRGAPIPVNQTAEQLETERRAVDAVRLAEEALDQIQQNQTRPDITPSIEAERTAINQVREAAEKLAAVYGASTRTVGQAQFFDDRQLRLLVFASGEAEAALKSLETIQNSGSASAEQLAAAQERLTRAVSLQQRAATRISADAGVIDAARELSEAQRALQLVQRSGVADAKALADAQTRVTTAYEAYGRASRTAQSLSESESRSIAQVRRAQDELGRVRASGTASTDELRAATDRLNDAFDEMASSPVALIIDGITSSTDALSRSLGEAELKMRALARAQIDEAASRRQTIPEVFRNIGPEQEAAGFGAPGDFPALGQNSSSLTPEERLRLTQEQAAKDRQAQNEALQEQLRRTAESERAASEAERAYRESIEGRTAEIIKRSNETRARALAEAAVRETVGVEGDSVGQLQADFRRADAIFEQMRSRLEELGVEIPASVRDMIDQTVATARQKSKTAGEQIGGILGFLLARRLGMGQDPGAGLIRVPAAQQAALSGAGQQQVINFNGPISYGAGVTTGDVQQGTSVALRMALSQQ